MSDIVSLRNIGALLSVPLSVAPQSGTGGAINGATIDRAAHNNPLSCLLRQVAGAVSGAPTTTSVVSKVQHAPDGATWTDYMPDGVNVATTAALTAANTTNSLAVSLTSAQRYIRVVTTVTFTGGTSPAVLVAADAILAGEDEQAAI